MTIKYSFFGDYYLSNKASWFGLYDYDLPEESEDLENSENLDNLENSENSDKKESCELSNNSEVFDENSELSESSESSEDCQKLDDEEEEDDGLPEQYEEFVISKTYDVFNLFSQIMPANLSYYVKKARILDEKIFTPHLCRAADPDFYNSTSLKLNQTPLDYITESLNIQKEEFILDLGNSMRSYDSFYLTLLDDKNPILLNVIEKYTQDKSKIHHSEWFKLTDDYKAKYEGMLMIMAGASSKCIKKATGLHHSTVGKLYAKQNDITKPDDIIPCAKGSKASMPVVIRKLMTHIKNNKQVMLMVALYNMCARMILRKNGLPDFLSSYALPEKISTILATGAYSTVIILNEFLNQYFEDQSQFSKRFDNIDLSLDEFMIVLENLNTKEAEIMRCSKCNTPYLYISDNVIDGEILYEFCEPQPCPSCGHIENKLEEIADSENKNDTNNQDAKIELKA